MISSYFYRSFTLGSALLRWSRPFFQFAHFVFLYTHSFSFLLLLSSSLLILVFPLLINSYYFWTVVIRALQTHCCKQPTINVLYQIALKAFLSSFPFLFDNIYNRPKQGLIEIIDPNSSSHDNVESYGCSLTVLSCSYILDHPHGLIKAYPLHVSFPDAISSVWLLFRTFIERNFWMTAALSYAYLAPSTTSFGSYDRKAWFKIKAKQPHICCQTKLNRMPMLPIQK